MTRQTRVIELQEEAQRLEQQLDEVVNEALAIEEEVDEEALTDHQAYADALVEGDTTERHLRGVLNLVENYNCDRVTIGAQRTGELAQVQDLTLDIRDERKGRTGKSNVAGASRAVFVAAGIVDAPFVDGDASIEQRARAINAIEPETTAWLEEQIEDLSTPDVSVKNGFRERLAQRRDGAAETPPSTSPTSSDSPE
ncbi:hypothetical protein [Halomarina rubra]|uniref:Uncharacterized protein n=1 Tax=Halomarina rubra TaxID=2071873 RepID=A0ABD6AT75_9EURY|nr:hypothetical protein [Halomarina rubra]